MSCGKSKRDGKTLALNSSMKKGMGLLLATGILLAMLIWFIPDVLGLNLSALLSSVKVLAMVRVALGACALSLLASSLFYVGKSFALDGESIFRGLANAVHAHVVGRDAVSIVLLLGGGIALIVWGLGDLL